MFSDWNVVIALILLFIALYFIIKFFQYDPKLYTTPNNFQTKIEDKQNIDGTTENFLSNSSINNNPNMVVDSNIIDMIDNTRVYPGLFAYQKGFSSYSHPYTSLPFPNNMNGYHAKRTDYWYIPAHESLNSWINGYSGTQNFKIPQTINTSDDNRTCINQCLQNHGNLDLAINQCAN